MTIDVEDREVDLAEQNAQAVEGDFLLEMPEPFTAEDLLAAADKAGLPDPADILVGVQEQRYCLRKVRGRDGTTVGWRVHRVIKN
jgi:hypothetical protein